MVRLAAQMAMLEMEAMALTVEMLMMKMMSVMLETCVTAVLRSSWRTSADIEFTGAREGRSGRPALPALEAAIVVPAEDALGTGQLR